MLVSSRRSLILGLGSLIVAPALVRASSLMPLRGYDMDPWVIGFQFMPENLMKYSVFNKERPTRISYENWVRLPLIEKIKYLNDKNLYGRGEWEIKRKSETYEV